MDKVTDKLRLVEEIISQVIDTRTLSCADLSNADLNKRHGAEKITKVLNLVDDQFLESKALRSQQNK